MMVAVTVGAGKDYETLTDLLVGLTAIAPLADDYRITVDDGIYSEAVLWDIDTGGNSVELRAANKGLAIIDAQTTRDHCLEITGGALKVHGMRFEDGIAENVIIQGTAVGKCEFRGCSSYRGTIGIADWNNDEDFTCEGCYFEDVTAYNAVETYSDGSTTKIVRGCWAHTTATGATYDFGFQIDGGTGGGGFATTGSIIEGCRVTTADITKGPSAGIFGADFFARRCRMIGTRGVGFRNGWDTNGFRLEDCLDRSATGSAHYGGILPVGAVWTILRCTFDGNGDSYTAIPANAGSNIEVKNCVFRDLKVDDAIEVALGGTVDNAHNCYDLCAGTVSGAGTYNNPETGELIADSEPDPASVDAVVPLPTSPLIQAGVADGLPYNGTAPDIGCEQFMPPELQEA